MGSAYHSFRINLHNSLFYFTLIIVYVVLPSVVRTDVYYGTEIPKVVFLGAAILISSALLVYFISGYLPEVKFTAIDISIFVLFGFLFVNYCLHEVRPNKLYELFYLQLLYVFVRLLPVQKTDFALMMLVFGCIIQCLLANLQLYGIYPSYNTHFKVTGSFSNPGPLAAYLISILPIAIAMFLFNKDKIDVIRGDGRNFFYRISLTYLPLFCVSAVVLILPVTKSRAALLAMVCSTAYLLWVKYADKIRFFLQGKSIFTWLFLLITAPALMYFLFSIKTASSYGRIFIWKNCLAVLRDNFFLGVGSDSFAARYMDQQGVYFANLPDSKYINFADQTKYAFNDLLQFFTENGLIGLILLLILIFLILRAKPNTYRSVACLAGLISVAAFSFFSYPLEILPIQINVIFFVAVISNENRGVYTFRFSDLRYIGTGRILCVLVWFVLAWNNLVFMYNLTFVHRSWISALQQYKLENYITSVQIYQRIFPDFKTDPDFLSQYGKNLFQLQEYQQAVIILQRSIKYGNSQVAQLTLGDSYRQMNKPLLAERAYLDAHHLIPSREYPLYLLAKLYVQTNQKNKAILIIKELLLKPVKVQSVASDEMREEMQELLVKLNSQSVK